MKIYNPTAKNSKIYACGKEVLEFNEEGIAEVKSEELYKSLLELANFFPVEEEKAKEVEAKKEVEKNAEKEEKEVKKTKVGSAKK